MRNRGTSFTSRFRQAGGCSIGWLEAPSKPLAAHAHRRQVAELARLTAAEKMIIGQGHCNVLMTGNVNHSPFALLWRQYSYFKHIGTHPCKPLRTAAMYAAMRSFHPSCS